jgi:hypothetical protein
MDHPTAQDRVRAALAQPWRGEKELVRRKVKVVEEAESDVRAECEQRLERKPVFKADEAKPKFEHPVEQEDHSSGT